MRMFALLEVLGMLACASLEVLAVLPFASLEVLGKLPFSRAAHAFSGIKKPSGHEGPRLGEGPSGHEGQNRGEDQKALGGPEAFEDLDGQSSLDPFLPRCASGCTSFGAVSMRTKRRT